MKIVELPKETHYACREIAKERDDLKSVLRTLLAMHDAEVFVAAPWNTTFEEARALLARSGSAMNSAAQSQEKAE